MPRFLIPPSIQPEVLPEHGVSRDRLEHHTLSFGTSGSLLLLSPLSLVVVALYKLAPLLVLAPLAQQRELSSTTHQPSTRASLAGRIHPNHHAAHSPPSSPGRRPVVMVRVVAPGDITLHAQPLHPDLVPPALQGARACLDALDGRRARDQSDRGVADRGIVLDRGASPVRDRRGLEDRIARGILVCTLCTARKEKKTVLPNTR